MSLLLRVATLRECPRGIIGMGLLETLAQVHELPLPLSLGTCGSFNRWQVRSGVILKARELMAQPEVLLDPLRRGSFSWNHAAYLFHGRVKHNLRRYTPKPDSMEVEDAGRVLEKLARRHLPLYTSVVLEGVKAPMSEGVKTYLGELDEMLSKVVVVVMAVVAVMD